MARYTIELRNVIQIFGENKYTFYKLGLKSTMKYINCQEAFRQPSR